MNKTDDNDSQCSNQRKNIINYFVFDYEILKSVETAEKQDQTN